MKSAVILTALEVETRAALRQLGKTALEAVDGTQCHVGSYGCWKVAVIETGPGNVSAAAISARILKHFAPQVALFVGIAGGVKDVAIGDVVVGTKVYGYETGKDLASKFRPRPDVLRAAHAIEQLGRAKRLHSEWYNRLDASLAHKKPRVFVAPIAAGEKVVASEHSGTAKFINEQYGDAVAVEMEGRGFLEGIHISGNVLGGVIRGISDLLSGKAAADKSGSQELAADAASAFAFEILQSLDSETKPEPANEFLSMPFTFCRGSYFQKGDVLARIGEPNSDEIQFIAGGQLDGYFRIIPMMARQAPLPIADLKLAAERAGLLGSRTHGGFTSVNQFGVIFYQPDRSYPKGIAPLHWGTQLFPNGELWSFTDRMIIRELGERPSWCPIPCIAASFFEASFRKTLHKNLLLALDRLGLSLPCKIELGVCNLSGVSIAYRADDIRGPIQVDSAISETLLQSGDEQSIDEVLLEFFRLVHDKTGYSRPQSIDGFPAGQM
jgi:nucleoside phosphorylase